MLTSEEKNKASNRQNLKDKLRHAFAVGEEYAESLTEEEERLLDEIASNIYRQRLSAVAIPFLMFHKPLNFVAANFIQMGEIVFTLGPVEGFLRKFLGPSYSHQLLVSTLEKRCSIDRLVEKLEILVDGAERQESS